MFGAALNMSLYIKHHNENTFWTLLPAWHFINVCYLTWCPDFWQCFVPFDYPEIFSVLSAHFVPAGWSRGHHIVCTQLRWWGKVNTSTICRYFSQTSRCEFLISACKTVFSMCVCLRSVSHHSCWSQLVELCCWSSGTGSKLSVLAPGGPFTLFLWPVWPLTPPLLSWQQVSKYRTISCVFCVTCFGLISATQTL